jgi:hypothetical protein
MTGLRLKVVCGGGWVKNSLRSVKLEWLGTVYSGEG